MMGLDVCTRFKKASAYINLVWLCLTRRVERRAKLRTKKK